MTEEEASSAPRSRRRIAADTEESSEPARTRDRSPPPRVSGPSHSRAAEQWPGERDYGRTSGR